MRISDIVQERIWTLSIGKFHWERGGDLPSTFVICKCFAIKYQFQIYMLQSFDMDGQCGNVVATFYALLLILTYLIFSFLRSTDGKCFLET